MLKSFAVVASSLLISSTLHAAELRIIGSIKPITMIASEISSGVAEVESLLPPGASPHDFALKPSDRRLLDDADFLFWTGPQTEPYLEKVIKASGIKQLAWVGEDEADQHDDHGHTDHHDDHQSHDDHEGHDDHADHNGHEDHHDAHGEAEDMHGDHHDHDHDQFHPWLAPDNALEFAERVADELKELAPESRDRIDANLHAFEHSLEQMEAANQQRLEGLQELGFVVFHDAYRGLVDHYGLNQVAAFSVDPSRKAGARHLQELREQLEAQNIRCVFIEPQFEPAVLDSITRGLPVKRGELDPLATQVEMGEGAYARFLGGLVDEIATCLSE